MGLCSCSEEFYFSMRQWKMAVINSSTSRYLSACAVYVAYSVAMVMIDSPSLDAESKNKYYFEFGIVHFINSLMFIWTWTDKSYFDKVMIPEYLNVLGAVLYLTSSTMYGHEYTTDDDGAAYTASFYCVRYLEFCASFVEVFAALGWIYSWHVEYLELIAHTPGPIPSRGWTFDDPDLSANITIAVAAIIYFTYNCQVMADYSQYESNVLYQLGDQVYMLNSLIYLVAALRDCHWFWFMPKFGQYKTISEIMHETGSLQTINGAYYTKVEDDSNETSIPQIEEEAGER